MGGDTARGGARSRNRGGCRGSGSGKGNGCGGFFEASRGTLATVAGSIGPALPLWAPYPLHILTLVVSFVATEAGRYTAGGGPW